MKKKIAALVCTFALVAAMPVMAWANPSPEHKSAEQTSEQGTTFVVGYNGSGTVTVTTSTTQQASNVELTSTMKAIGSYVITADGQVSGPYTFTFGGLDEYNGATVTVFIQHENSTEVQTATVKNGSITITTNDLSVVTIAVDTATVPASANNGDNTSTAKAKASTDSSATSPQTDVDLSGVAGATVACAVAAAGVGIALRKKATK